MSEHDLSASNVYFDEVLPWQKQAWKQLSTQFYEHKLPHAMLAAGMAGIGKREFVWRFVAWLLCQNRLKEGACGVCQSCTWLKAGTHPDLMVLPQNCLPTQTGEACAIKVDDIRALQDYSHTTGQHLRLIVIDHADKLTIAAVNALLKTLEEPQSGVYICLISDHASRLAATLKSRVQMLPLTQIEYAAALSFVTNKLGDESLAKLALNLADGALLSATKLPKTAWFDKRLVWLKTWLVLRQGRRLPIVASDYWQSVLSFEQFVVLTRLMLIDVVRVCLGLNSHHSDIDVVGVLAQMHAIDVNQVQDFLEKLDEMTQAVKQNVQPKIAYDELICMLALL